VVISFAHSIANEKTLSPDVQERLRGCWQRQPYPFGDSLKHFFAAL